VAQLWETVAYAPFGESQDRRDWETRLSWNSVAYTLIGRPYSLDRFPSGPLIVPAVPQAGHAGPLSRRIGLLFRLPAMASGHYSFPPVRTLGDQVLLALSSREYMSSRQDFAMFLPLLAGALVLQGMANPLMLPAQGLDVTRTVVPAVKWLTGAVLDARGQTPEEVRIELMIEKLVKDIAWHRLDTTKLTPPLPTPLTLDRGNTSVPADEELAQWEEYSEQSRPALKTTTSS
jgi:hypothetical protein